MNKRRIYYLLTALFLSSFLCISCSSSTVKVQNPVVGIIEVVGNEPFTKLAVNINNKDVYLLDCSGELKAELMKNRGKVCEIIYSDIKDTEEGIMLTVNKVIPIKAK